MTASARGFHFISFRFVSVYFNVCSFKHLKGTTKARNIMRCYELWFDRFNHNQSSTPMYRTILYYD